MPSAGGLAVAYLGFSDAPAPRREALGMVDPRQSHPIGAPHRAEPNRMAAAVSSSRHAA
jgi:hypothetical protein